MGYLNRDTKNTNQGKERFLTINQETIENAYAKAQSELCKSARLTENLAQGSTCPPLPKGQNGPIKDKSEEQAPLEEDKNKKDKFNAGSSQTSSGIPKEKKNEVDISELSPIDKEVVDKNPNRYIKQDDSTIIDICNSKKYRLKEKE